MSRLKSLVKPLYHTAISIVNFFVPKRVALEWCKLYYNKSELIFVDNYVKIPIALKCYYSMTDDEQELFNKKHIWGGNGSGVDWHNKVLNGIINSKTDTKPKNSEKRLNVVKFIKTHIKLNGSLGLMEIGCGIGELAYAISQDKLLGSCPYHGYDISDTTIETAKYLYPNLTFSHGDWKNAISDFKGKEDIIIITSGTLEFFTPSELNRFLSATIKNIKRGYLLLYEPINIDIESDIMSKPRGGFAYSHNYPKYIEQCGLDLVALQSKPSPTSLTHGTNTVDLLVCARWGQ